LHCLSRSPADTAATAQALARAIDAEGLVVALVGPLGAGKTVFVQGLARGLGIDPARVTSPTFVIAAHHADPAQAHPLVHADFYRVESERELEAAGWLDWIAPGTVVAAEWGDRFPAAFPADSIEVRIAAPGPGAPAPAPAPGCEEHRPPGCEERRIALTPRGPRSRATLARMLRARGAEAAT
jgi:tRNA threonylcarbamoyladenosine biosynthesis protein TsaE